MSVSQHETPWYKTLLSRLREVTVHPQRPPLPASHLASHDVEANIHGIPHAILIDVSSANRVLPCYFYADANVVAVTGKSEVDF